MYVEHNVWDVQIILCKLFQFKWEISEKSLAAEYWLVITCENLEAVSSFSKNINLIPSSLSLEGWIFGYAKWQKLMWRRDWWACSFHGPSERLRTSQWEVELTLRSYGPTSETLLNDFNTADYWLYCTDTIYLLKISLNNILMGHPPPPPPHLIS